MAVVTIGTISIDLTVPQLNLFPSVPIPADTGKFFGLSTVPNPVPLPDRGYFLVIPIIQAGAVELERPVLTKWFPKNRIFSFKFTTPANLGDPLTVTMALYPIIPFGNFIGGPVDIGLIYDDVLIEPPNLVI